MAHLMQQLAEHQGYCCVKEMFQDLEGKPAQRVADKLGVSVRAVNNWRKRIKEGEELCKQLPNCSLPPKSFE